jgi:hypothetical protein
MSVLRFISMLAVLVFASLAQAQFPSPYSMPIAPTAPWPAYTPYYMPVAPTASWPNYTPYYMPIAPTASWPYYGAWHYVPYCPSYYAAEPLPIVPTTPLTAPIPDSSPWIFYSTRYHRPYHTPQQCPHRPPSHGGHR